LRMAGAGRACQKMKPEEGSPLQVKLHSKTKPTGEFHEVMNGLKFEALSVRGRCNGYNEMVVDSDHRKFHFLSVILYCLLQVFPRDTETGGE
jgi:hypothetical protein